jgi:3-deoxy-D-manno-octulosonic-acid transferase
VARDRITITGDPRFDSVLGLVASSSGSALPVQRTGNPALVAGSTWGPDDEVLLEAFATVRSVRPGVRLLLAPHEPAPAHLDAVDALALRHGLPRPVRLGSAAGTAEFLLVDRVGVLARLYGLGEAAYVGGAFGRAGLHSVLEPAAWGVPVLFGPRWQNSREAGLLLDAGAGIALPSRGAAARLADVWLQWLDDEGSRRTAGERALQVVRSGAGGALSNAELVEKAI